MNLDRLHEGFLVDRMSSLRRTCLHDFNAARGARFVDFAGWEMPVQFRSILEEHRAVRSAAGLFDVSHMGEVAIRGPQAADLVNRLITNDAAKLFPGRVLYSPMCHVHGGVIDDLLVSMRTPEEFLICLNAANAAKDIAWMQQHAPDFDCTVTDESDQWGLIALQGPNVPAILQPLTDASLADLKYYHFVEAPVAGAQTLISRTGYTGEVGYELFCPWGQAATVAAALENEGRKHHLMICGLGARDSLRLEAGYPLYGHELSDDISPLQAGLGWTVKLNKAADFVGRDALAKEKAEGARRRVVFFRTGDRRIVRSGTPVNTDSGQAGQVLSGTLSPMLGEAIGTALVDSNAAEDGLFVDLRGNRVALQLVRPPFISLPKQ